MMMMEHMRLALIGGEEFADGFEPVHEALIAGIAEGRSRGVFLPTCATHDGLDVVRYWSAQATQRLSPYAASVTAPLVVDAASANDPATVALVNEADWLYIGGGFPHIGMEILQGSAVLAALVERAQRGTLIIGASAGAMMLCSRSIVITPEVFSGGIPAPLVGLGFLPNSMCVPHFDRSYARQWQEADRQPAGHTMIGIDEFTALTNLHGQWEALGRGTIALFGKDRPLQRFRAGARIDLATYLGQ